MNKVKYWCIFKKGVPYRALTPRSRDHLLYQFLISNKIITVEDMNNMGFRLVEKKLEKVNKGGKFQLKQIDKFTWSIKFNPKDIINKSPTT